MVVETLTFRLVTGADEHEFVAADRAVQTELIPNQEGFARRTTARGPDGEWIVVTLWWAPEQAEAYHGLTRESPVAQRFISFAAPDSLRWARYLTLD
ncbi:MAG TPA: hypothetical protein VFH50_10070 [Acidimicrobiales bacterium]|nr:hypothetical protein [Acidimicrobiales bacterium]